MINIATTKQRLTPAPPFPDPNLSSASKEVPVEQKRTGVANANVIDLVTLDPEADTCVLILVEERPWRSEADQYLQLQAKLNHYMTFALDGPLQIKFPSMAGKQIRIQLDCVEPPDAETAAILALVGGAMKAEGLEFKVNVLSQPQRG